MNKSPKPLTVEPGKFVSLVRLFESDVSLGHIDYLVQNKVAEHAPGGVRFIQNATFNQPKERA